MLDFEHLKGMLWGLVVGDCIGSPIQFSSKDHHRIISGMEPAVGVYGVDFPAGYWTDDSSMAFCVMESLMRLKRYDLQDIANNFVKWLENGFMSSWEGRAFDVGGATYHAIRGIQQGMLKNGNDSTQGNGSIMRFAPGFIWSLATHCPNINEEISDLTHNSPAIRGLVRQISEKLTSLLNGDKSVIHSTHTRESVPNSGWAFATVEAAYWALCHFDSFREGMLAAVNLGGDSDSIGAVYGQLAGAYYGFSAIPEEWIRQVKNWQWVDSFIDDFLKLADAKSSS